MFKPSEIIGIVSATLLKQSEAAEVVYVEGIYQERQSNPKWAACYDGLRNETMQDELTLRINKVLEKVWADAVVYSRMVYNY